MLQLLIKLRRQTLRDYGCTMSPFAARDLVLGLETMALRVARQCESALSLAHWLEQHPSVAWAACKQHLGCASLPKRTD